MKNKDYKCENNEEIEFHPFLDMRESWISLKRSRKIMYIGIFAAILMFVFYQDDVAQKQYNYLNMAHSEYDQQEYDQAIDHLNQYLEGGNSLYWFAQKQFGNRFYSRSYEYVKELRDQWYVLSQNQKG